MEKPRRGTTEAVPLDGQDETRPGQPDTRADEDGEYDPGLSPDEGTANTLGTERETDEDRVEREQD